VLTFVMSIAVMYEYVQSVCKTKHSKLK